MFTSRAEYRLMLREDNADLRLTATGRGLGLVDDVRWDVFSRKRDAIDAEKERLGASYVSAGSRQKVSKLELLRRPEVTYASVEPDSTAAAEVAAQVEVQAKYEGYIDRQRQEVERRREHECLALPRDLDYAAVRGLSTEVRQKLAAQRPETLGQASRISGVTPAAISLLLVHLKKHRHAAKRSA